MKRKALWIALIFVPALSADPVTCNAGAASIPIFNPASTSGAVGDYTLDCTGGTPVPPTDPTPTIDVTAFMNVSILNTGGWILTDGVHNTPGTLGLSNEIDFLGVPFDPPGAGNLNLEVENIFVNPSGEAPGFQFNEIASLTSNFFIPFEATAQEVAVNAIPEPSTLLLLIACAVGVFARRTAVPSPKP